MIPLFKLDDLNTDTRILSLPESFYRRVKPSALKNPYLVSFSPAMAELLDIDPDYMHSEEMIQTLSGNRLVRGVEPVATIYSGHQFGQYVSQLGDGRALTYGEVLGRDGQAWELQLKGAGLTPFSRMGDGRAVLRSTIREYLCSEAMAGLGIPTTRALCITGSDDEVYRETIETAAVLTRVSPSHLRFGNFEIFFYRQQFTELKALGDFVLEHFYPASREAANPYLDLLQQVIDRTAYVIAQWQLVGFTHGVMNSDNMSILGLTIDYGPFGFLDTYTNDFVCNHTDQQGRYAYDQQPRVGLFNLSCLAQALLPLINDQDGNVAAEQAKAALETYQATYTRYYEAGMRDKLGLRDSRDDDSALFSGLFDAMQGQVDFTRFFRALGEFDEHGTQSPLRDQFVERPRFDNWAQSYSERLRAESSDQAKRRAAMCATNPKYILRNYQLHEAIVQAQGKDYSEIENLLRLVSTPYEEHPELDDYAQEPPDWAKTIELSCSS